MIEIFGTMANDKINKYNEIIPLNTMMHAYEDQWNDWLPYAVNHDKTRCIGCSRMAGIFIEPQTAFLTVQALIGESDTDKKQINFYLTNNSGRDWSEEENGNYKRLLEIIHAHLSDNYKFIASDSDAIHDIGIVKRVLPKIWESCDDDGLVLLGNLEPVLPGIFRVGELLLFAHSFFRRNLSHLNSLNTPFLSKLQELSGHNQFVKIALDPDIIGLAGSQRQMREYAYWWGPKFDDDLSAIPAGVTRFENEDYDSLMSPIMQTECGWYKQDDRRTFECEEIIDTENIKNTREFLFGCRYVHSMLSSLEGNPCHLDGAIRAYTTEKMIIRLDASLDNAERNTKYTKLWRVDGEISVSLWKELITHYYRDNKLIGEYFSGVDKNTETKNETFHLTDHLDISYNSYIPVQLEPGDGLRLNISIHNKETFENDYDITVKPTLITKNESELKYYIESGSLSLIKYLERKGLNISRPSCNRIEYNDTAFNFPLLICKSNNEGNIVISCINDFCKIWSSRGDNRIISHSIQVNYSDYSITFSFLGHVIDFVSFFESGFIQLPETSDSLCKWAENIYTYANAYPSANRNPPYEKILRGNGELHYKRVCVPNDIYSGCISNEEGIYPDLRISEDDARKLEKQGINASFIFGNIKTDCSLCKCDYEKCGCVKFIDSKCEEIMTEGDIFGCFWTTRRA